MLINIGTIILAGACLLSASGREIYRSDGPNGRESIVRQEEAYLALLDRVVLFSSADLPMAQDAARRALGLQAGAADCLVISSLPTALALLGDDRARNVHYLEQFPDLVRAFRGLTMKELPAPHRLHYYTGDPLRVAGRMESRFDLIFAGAPVERAMVHDRYYSPAAFRLYRRLLKEDGILLFSIHTPAERPDVTSGPKIAGLIAVFRKYFPYFAVVPGSSSLFLLSGRELKLDEKTSFRSVNFIGDIPSVRPTPGRMLVLIAAGLFLLFIILRWRQSGFPPPALAMLSTLSYLLTMLHVYQNAITGLLRDWPFMAAIVISGLAGGAFFRSHIRVRESLLFALMPALALLLFWAARSPVPEALARLLLLLPLGLTAILCGKVCASHPVRPGLLPLFIPGALFLLALVWRGELFFALLLPVVLQVASIVPLSFRAGPPAGEKSMEMP